MEAQYTFANNFLIAMPGMMDPNFQRTVTYICEHNEHGAMGIILNRPLDLHLISVFRHVNIQCDNPDINHTPIMWGGPINSDQLFTLHHPAGEWESSLHLKNDIAITTSLDILQAVSEGKGPKKILIALGYAGWEAGQLEAEIAANLWLTGPYVQKVVFEAEFENRWTDAAAALGVDFNNLSSDAGHA